MEQTPPIKRKATGEKWLQKVLARLAPRFTARKKVPMLNAPTKDVVAGEQFLKKTVARLEKSRETPIRYAS